MKYSSPKITFDNRLLAVEELFRQRQVSAAISETEALTEADFQNCDHELGLLYLLRAEASFHQSNYRKALENGLKAVRQLADFPLNRRYGRAQWLLSKSYSAVGDLKNAEIRARDALSAYRRATHNEGQVDALNELARIAYIRNDYEQSLEALSDALELISDNPRKKSQITGNMGRVRVHLGQWAQAEKELKEALSYAVKHGEGVTLSANYMSLGLINIRRRDFVAAARNLDKAITEIDDRGLKRDRIIHMEYSGELAFERGDFYNAKTILSNAYHQGLTLAPDSALVSQSGRRLAEVELALDNIDEAMKYAQKALEVALALGEKVEIGLARRSIAMIFAQRGEEHAAAEQINEAIDVLRDEGDPYVLGRSLLVMAEVKMMLASEKSEKVQAIFDEASRIFRRLKLDYWVAEADYLAGIYACQQGDLSKGFKKLSRAERLFGTLNERARVRAVHKFLNSLSEQAVALSISSENSFKIFGNLVSPAEISDIKSSRLEEIISVLLKKTESDRGIIFTPEVEQDQLVASFEMSPAQRKRFADGFNQLLGAEISRERPTLILDCRRDPYINGLLADIAEIVASVVVVPIGFSDGTTGYLYLQKTSEDSTLKPFSQAELNFAVGFSDIIAFKWTEMQKAKLAEDNKRLKQQLQERSEFPNILTNNSQMLEILGQVKQIVNSNISISIEGATGTGKDLLARAIHYNSERRDHRFISVNCAALPETLLESELFGYKRGAFTGADRDKPGLFEEANGGTFFLDEIADMPLSIQAKILRVLESKELVRLGETTPRKTDVRILSATNKDLKHEMAEGRFRQDLYYRLSALTFRLPSLAERREDIPLLVDHFVEGSGKTVAPKLMQALTSYDWPGNIRELENEVKRMVLLAGDKKEIDIDVASSRIGRSGKGNGNGNGEQKAVAVPEDVSFDDDYSLYDYLAAHEKRFILRALREKRGVKKHAAAMLNIPESTLRLKIKQYNIDLNNLGRSS